MEISCCKGARAVVFFHKTQVFKDNVIDCAINMFVGAREALPWVVKTENVTE